jgi:protein involved in plasmid replication-relaxation
MSQLWWSQRRCQATWGAIVQPHGFGRWQKRGAVLDFFLECDSAADAHGRIATALAGYDELARTNPQLATLILLWMATATASARVATWSSSVPCRARR